MIAISAPHIQFSSTTCALEVALLLFLLFFDTISDTYLNSYRRKKKTPYVKKSPAPDPEVMDEDDYDDSNAIILYCLLFDSVIAFSHYYLTLKPTEERNSTLESPQLSNEKKHFLP